MHRCPHCRYSFPDAESLERHLDGGCPEEDYYDYHTNPGA